MFENIHNSQGTYAICNIMGGCRAGHAELALGLARARDSAAAGVPLVYFTRLVDAGALIRLGRGLYQTPDRVGEHAAHDLPEAAQLVPRGVVSLIGALQHHGLTTQLPHAVWMTIPYGHRTPSARSPRLEIVRATGEAPTAAVDGVTIEGVPVPIYGVAKTVADGFKHRRYVGEDVAIEALRDALRQRRPPPAS